MIEYAVLDKDTMKNRILPYLLVAKSPTHTDMSRLEELQNRFQSL